MLTYLWLIPALPLAGFLLLTLGGGFLKGRTAAWVGVGAAGLSALVAALVALSFWAAPPAGGAYTQVLYTWLTVGDLSPQIALYLDPVSLLMVLVVTGVGFLIHLYSVEYMAGDEGLRRFFAYLNLFIFSMLTLLLGENLLLLFLGWEGVGLCSYLLIGFWYKEPQNGYAARKAFIVTRVGDTAFTVGLLLLFTGLGTLSIQDLMQRAASLWPAGSPLAVAAAALLLGGALGKSAQLPLQTWLPDAMAGPTPVSALIHAATMVTAGVYLIARTHVLFALAPAVQTAVGAIGAVTLLVAGCSALTQHDIKRVLAYSTISQIGYMFLALGVGAWGAALFHFMTHAFFKALLFLGAGAVIVALHEEHDIRKMGGLRQKMPLVFWTFLAGAASLAAVPLVTAGYYSKDLILSLAFTSLTGGGWLWLAGLVGAFLTSLYIFRLVFLVFFGEAKSEPHHQPGLPFSIPLVVLGALALVGGFVQLPEAWGRAQFLTDWLALTLPAPRTVASGLAPVAGWIAPVVSLAGIYVAYVAYRRRPQGIEAWRKRAGVQALARFWRGGWGFDWLYDRALVRPFVALARLNRADVVNAFYDGLAWLADFGHRALSRTQTGRVRLYLLVVAAGTAVMLAIGVLR